MGGTMRVRNGQQQGKNGAFLKEIEVQKSHQSNQISSTSKRFHPQANDFYILPVGSKWINTFV